MKNARTVQFYIDGKPGRSLMTDTTLGQAIRSFVANLRFTGIYLDGRTVRAVAADGETERVVKVHGRHKRSHKRK